MGNGGVRISPAWLAASPSLCGGAKIHPGRRISNHPLYPGTLHVSRLGDQHESDSRRYLAFLRRAGWYGTSHLRTARRFCPSQDPDRIVRSQFVISGNRPTGLQPGHSVSTQLPARILAEFRSELREEFALRKIPTASFAANSLYLEIVRLAYNLVTAFQRNCLQESWQNLTLQRLRYKLFLLPGELTRPHNRPILRLKESPFLRDLARDILKRVHRLKSLQS